jgi:hypothetical protein
MTRHIILVSGKDSLAAALVQTTRYPGSPYEFLFTDVGAELPETYAWLAEVERKTGWTLQRVGRSLPDQIRAYGGFLPGPRARYCTRETKIEPMEAYLGADECVIYYGLRADEPERTGYVPLRQVNLVPAYPLREAGIDLEGVYAILDAQGLTPPDFFWPRLHAAVGEHLTGSSWEAKLSRTERRLLFAGRTRANCSFCFFQRQYEFVWLHETHPDLFAQAESLEKAEYSFQPGFFLRDLHDPARRQAIFERRVSEVCRVIGAKFQRRLFEEAVDNELALVSCGLLCGK